LATAREHDPKNHLCTAYKGNKKMMLTYWIGRPSRQMQIS